MIPLSEVRVLCRYSYFMKFLLLYGLVIDFLEFGRGFEKKEKGHSFKNTLLRQLGEIWDECIFNNIEFNAIIANLFLFLRGYLAGIARYNLGFRIASSA